MEMSKVNKMNAQQQVEALTKILNNPELVEAIRTDLDVRKVQIKFSPKQEEYVEDLHRQIIELNKVTQLTTTAMGLLTSYLTRSNDQGMIEQLITAFLERAAKVMVGMEEEKKYVC